MRFMQRCSPSGVVDGDVHQKLGIAGMDSLHQFDELLKRRGL